jgi:hypothetical protein
LKTEQPATLKPCPFCGDAPLEDRIEPHKHSPALMGLVPLPFSYPGSWSIECVPCGFRIFSHESRDNAVRLWNTRSPALEPVRENGLTDEQREALEYVCSLADSYPQSRGLNPNGPIATAISKATATVRSLTAPEAAKCGTCDGSGIKVHWDGLCVSCPDCTPPSSTGLT